MGRKMANGASGYKCGKCHLPKKTECICVKKRMTETLQMKMMGGNPMFGGHYPMMMGGNHQMMGDQMMFE